MPLRSPSGALLVRHRSSSIIFNGADRPPDGSEVCHSARPGAAAPRDRPMQLRLGPPVVQAPGVKGKAREKSPSSGHGAAVAPGGAAAHPDNRMRRRPSPLRAAGFDGSALHGFAKLHPTEEAPLVAVNTARQHPPLRSGSASNLGAKARASCASPTRCGALAMVRQLSARVLTSPRPSSPSRGASASTASLPMPMPTPSAPSQPKQLKFPFAFVPPISPPESPTGESEPPLHSSRLSLRRRHGSPKRAVTPPQRGEQLASSRPAWVGNGLSSSTEQEVARPQSPPHRRSLVDEAARSVSPRSRLQQEAVKEALANVKENAKGAILQGAALREFEKERKEERQKRLQEFVEVASSLSSRSRTAFATAASEGADGGDSLTPSTAATTPSPLAHIEGGMGTPAPCKLPALSDLEALLAGSGADETSRRELLAAGQDSEALACLRQALVEADAVLKAGQSPPRPAPGSGTGTGAVAPVPAVITASPREPRRSARLSIPKVRRKRDGHSSVAESCASTSASSACERHSDKFSTTSHMADSQTSSSKEDVVDDMMRPAEYVRFRGQDNMSYHVEDNDMAMTWMQQLDRRREERRHQGVQLQASINQLSYERHMLLPRPAVTPPRGENRYAVNEAATAGAAAALAALQRGGSVSSASVNSFMEQKVFAWNSPSA
eukprot:TRINITY_DN24746_c0_g1_i1.p1 TRINITY_DN24746_c0_g1~~TRINITY_DN24746_c0_g1_i1.p1  ORF type:complete len:668 (-),score=114.45 TRINITY_DN24746_c0_g1_i1:38-2041(-)